MLHPFFKRPLAALAIAAISLAPAMAQPAKVKLVLPALSMLFAPIYVANDGGYFKEAGVDVELGALPGPAALNAVIGGSAEFTSITGLLQLRAAQRGQKTIAIAGLQSSVTAEIVISSAAAERNASAKTPLERAKALKGLTLAVDAPNGLPHLYLRYVARQAGLDADKDIRLVFIGPAGMDAALQKSEIDGFVFSSPFTLEATRRGAKMWISNPNGDFAELHPQTYNLLVARDGYCRGATATCRAMVDAIDRGLQTIRTDPQRAMATLVKRFDRMDPALLKEAFDIFQRNAPSRSFPMGPAFEKSIDTMSPPGEDQVALKALAKSLFTDEYVSSGK